MFRRWANSILKQYLLKGYSIKDIGKKISHISKLESIDIDELLNKYEK